VVILVLAHAATVVLGAMARVLVRITTRPRARLASTILALRPGWVFRGLEAIFVDGGGAGPAPAAASALPGSGARLSRKLVQVAPRVAPAQR
jgi:hypothetical protein